MAEDTDIIARLDRIERLLEEQGRTESRVEQEEEDELAELERLERLEEEIHHDVAPHPLTRITYRDVSKGIIGSFFGIVGHFAFFYGEKLAQDLSLLRANGLVLTSLIILILFIYFSGFRTIARDAKHHYIFWRTLVIFVVAHAVIVFVLFLFGRLSFAMGFLDIYRNIAAVSILAVMGAATADLIGGE